MNTFLKNTIIGAATLVLLAPMAAMAQKSGGGVTGEARLHPGTWNTSRSYQSYSRSRPSYRNAMPEIVRSERTPVAVAQTPSERRSFSYEPSQRRENKASQSSKAECGCDCNCGCGSIERSASKEKKVEASTEGRRSYSYEPSANERSVTSEPSVAPQRSYSTSGSRMQSLRSSSWKAQSGSKMERNTPRN